MPDLELVQIIGRGSHFTVYRAVRGSEAYALKVFEPAAGGSSANRVGEGRRQAARMARARHECLPRILTVDQAGETVYVVMELIEGQPLSSVLRRGPLPEPAIVDLGRKLAEALAVLHGLGLVHRDVKPGNIMLRPSGPPALVDFDLLEPAADISHDEIAGAPRDSPPEQSGGLSQPVDARSDLYSLGAVLFECAAGQAPQGMAAVPTPGKDAVLVLRDLNPGVSAAFSAIVAKLLSPDPDDRYQSASELLRDLAIVPQLELCDQPPAGGVSSLAHAPLMGREGELERLGHLWQLALRERGTVAVISGSVGSGKTSLLRAFRQELLQTGRLVLEGRCTEIAAAPFAALRAAFEHWLGQLRHAPAAARGLAEQRLRIAAGDFGRLLRLFSPAFDQALSDLPPASESELLHERFYDILAEFLLKLAGCYGGLALLVDDVHWLDNSTREVLMRVGARLEGAPLLVVLTAHAEGPATARSSHAEWLRTIARIETLRLAPLSEPACGQLVASLLGVDEVEGDLSAHVASWTAGNPLAIEEYVDALVDAGVLRPEWGTWRLDSGQLQSLRLPRDVVRLVESRVRELSPRSVDVLRLASLMDGDIDPGLLDDMLSPDDVAGALREGVDGHLIRSANGGFAFSHDSVRAALAAGVPPDEIRDMHQQIAEALDRLPHDSTRRSIYAIARHYLLGHAEGDWQRVYDKTLAAGIAAVGTFADAEAYDFLLQAARAAGAAGITPSTGLHVALGDVCARSGRWDEALTQLNTALDRIAEPVARAALHARLAKVYVANRQTHLAWEHVQRGLRDLGAPLAQRTVFRLAGCALRWLTGFVALHFAPGRGAVSNARRPRLQMLSELCVVGGYVAYLRNEPVALLDLVVRQLWLGYRLGDSWELAGALTSYAVLLATLGRGKAAERYSRRALALVERVGDRFQLARLRMFDAWQRHVGGHPRQGELSMRRCLQADGSWLDAADLAYGHIDLVWNLIMRGHMHDALLFLESALARAQPNTGERANLEIKAAIIFAVLGRHADAQELIGRLAQTTALMERGWVRMGYLGSLPLVLLERGELGSALDQAIRDCYDIAPRRPGLAAFHMRYCYVFAAYARLELCMRDPNRDRVKAFEQSVTLVGRAGRHPTLRAHYLVLRGALDRLQGHPRRSLQRLLHAQPYALESDNIWALYQLHRQLAHTLGLLDNHQAAVRQARAAHRLATAEGWVNRAHAIAAEFPALRPAPEPAGQPVVQAAEPVRDVQRLEQHLEALLQVSLAAGATVDPARQAQVALDETLRVLQGQRAFLFTTTPYGELVLRAGRNAQGDDLQELTGYSRTVVETVRTSCEPVVATGTEYDRVQPADGTHTHDLRSLIAAPLVMKGELLGVVYVDTQLAHGAFTDDDLRILSALANHLAIALQNASTLAQQTALTRANSDLLEELRGRVAELQDSRRQITAAEERLRREIAEMLHSRVQSKLLVAAHQLGRATALVDDDPSEAKRLLNLSQTQLDEVREREIRDASHLLHPSIIRIGLGPAIRSLIGRFQDMFDVALEIEPRVAKLDGIVDNLLPDELRLTAYRGVEEALTNIARHAHASAVRISLAMTASQELLLRIEDNGVGFDADKFQPGLGLSSLDGRINQLGGTWRLSSKAGQGTTVEMLFPLREP